MANALVNLLKKGDRDAVNAYLSQQTIGSDDSGMTINGQPNNALAAMTRQQVPQIQQMPQIPQDQQPNYGQSRNVITNASLGYGPMGQRQGMIGGRQGSFDEQGNFITQTDSGDQVKIGAGELAQWKAQGDQMRQQQALANQFEQAKVMEQIGKAREAMQGGGMKPTFNADAGGYVYPPSPENPQGKFVPVQGFQAGANKPLTEYQGQSVMFGTRAADSHNLLNSLEDKISTTGLKTAQATENIPLIGSLAHAALTPEQQQVDQAQRNFVNAVMRRESGATISPSEFDNAKKQYFPQPGDSEAVIEQKRRNREMVVTGFARGAGAGSKDINEVLKANPYGQMQTPQAHPQDVMAVQWAKSNPNDPRSAAILKANGL